MTEMIVALFLASVGMVTVFGMQVAANVIQRHARDINAARMLGESFLTQLRGETVNWTTPGTVVDCTDADMPLCYHALNSAAGGQGLWMAVPNQAGNSSPRYNALGIPNDDNDPRVIQTAERQRLNSHNQRYCLHYNLSPVASLVAPGELLRAQVRVFWPMTDDAFAPAPTGVPDCGFADPAILVAASVRGQFRYIQLSTVLYRHEDLL